MQRVEKGDGWEMRLGLWQASPMIIDRCGASIIPVGPAVDEWMQCLQELLEGE